MGKDLTFIIPAYNEEKYIGSLLASIQGSIAGLDYEIIVVDNGSTDSTASIAKRYNANVVTTPRGSVSHARNIGAGLAKAAVIAFIDADVRITPRWGSEIARKLDYVRTNNVLTGSVYVIPDNPTRIERDWFLPLSMRRVTYINGGNLVLRKKTFSEVGGFDESMISGEDYEFSLRARDKGNLIEINPRLEAIHDGYPKNIKEFTRREIWHGKGDCQSIERFFESRVSIAAALFGILHLLLLGVFLYGSYAAALVVICLMVFVCVYMSFRIFSHYGVLLVLRNVPLCYLYLMSRLFSCIIVIFGAPDK